MSLRDAVTAAVCRERLGGVYSLEGAGVPSVEDEEMADAVLAVLREGEWHDGAVERIERTLFAVLPPEVLPTLRTKLAEGLLRAAVGEETL